MAYFTNPPRYPVFWRSPKTEHPHLVDPVAFFAALILGPIAEANFIQGSMIANATVGMGTFFFTGWLNWLLILIVIASIAYSVWMEIMARRYTTKDDAVAKEEALS